MTPLMANETFTSTSDTGIFLWWQDHRAAEPQPKDRARAGPDFARPTSRPASCQGAPTRSDGGVVLVLERGGNCGTRQRMSIECAACLDASVAKGFVVWQRIEPGKAMLLRTVAMLTRRWSVLILNNSGCARVHQTQFCHRARARRRRARRVHRSLGEGGARLVAKGSSSRENPRRKTKF